MPRLMDDVNCMEAENMEKAALFYQTCAWDQWLTELPDKLELWTGKIDTYINEFEGKWKYFAACDRIESINVYGGDDDDYDEEGNIIKEGIPNERLEPYTILYYLYQDETIDIVLQTGPEDLKGMFHAMIAYEKSSLASNFKKICGIDLPLYRKDKNGNMVKMSSGEIQMYDIERQYAAAERAFFLHVIARSVQECISKLKVLKYNEDNVEALTEIRSMAQDILDMNLNRFIRKKDRSLLEDMMRQ